MAQLKEFTDGRKPVTFMDLFAGAGGISEGFLQAYTDCNYYDFVLASDINENCELTHKVRYNEQLGLDTKFITEDIMSPAFLPRLKQALDGRVVDVVTGGPSCQSFSLSGRRRRFDKRDGLFKHYLKVIRALRPKYFVMENVKGLLTKDNGRLRSEIIREMCSIIDDVAVEPFLEFAGKLLKESCSPFLAGAFYLKLQMETAGEEEKAADFKERFFDMLDGQLCDMTRRIDYRISKSDKYIGTIRHGLYLLRHNERRDKIAADIIDEKTVSNIDNDLFVEGFDCFLSVISDENISSKIKFSIGKVEAFADAVPDADDLVKAVDLYMLSLDECFDELRKMSEEAGSGEECGDVIAKLRLYNVEQMVLLSSDYGVPQNRERVVFIGSRNDQKPVKSIPATVDKKDRVTVYEAISDLDFIGNGETVTQYLEPVQHPEYDGLIRRREVGGKISDEGKTFAGWSRDGRLNHRFRFDCQPFYVRDSGEFEGGARETAELFNHQTNFHNDTVKRRLEVIAEYGGYTDECKEKLRDMGLESHKRNYFVLKADGQSPTVTTMPDDFIHYSGFRAMTVREMARLQSFDDSFVFQGKRQTGGDKRKSEIPQYTLVGNSVPPLMARAIGVEILKNIE